jgi:hypothetical protein
MVAYAMHLLRRAHVLHRTGSRSHPAPARDFWAMISCRSANTALVKVVGISPWIDTAADPSERYGRRASASFALNFVLSAAISALVASGASV